MPSDDVHVRHARGDELAATMAILDAAMLEVEAGAVRARIADGEREADGDGVFVAVEDGRLLGALVLDGSEVEAVAVRPGRRGQGIGTALVEAADAETRGPLVAEFDDGVRPFYEALGFEVTRVGEGRWRGRRP